LTHSVIWRAKFAVTQDAARAIGLQSRILSASTSAEIDAAFATFVREKADALFVAPDSFFISRRVQFATLTASGIFGS